MWYRGSDMSLGSDWQVIRQQTFRPLISPVLDRLAVGDGGMVTAAQTRKLEMLGLMSTKSRSSSVAPE